VVFIDANQDTRCDPEEKLGIHGAMTTRYPALTIPEQKVLVGPVNVAEPNRENCVHGREMD